MNSKIYFALWLAIAAFMQKTPLLGQAPTKVASCHGQEKPIDIGSNMPYFPAKLGNATGMFLVDFAATYSTIDTNAFDFNDRPRPVVGTNNSFSDFDFFSPQGNVTLAIQDHSYIRGLPFKQAGIIGTDFLSEHIFTLDYHNKLMYRADSGFCDDQFLRSEGFIPVSTAGFYTNQPSTLPANTANVPTVPVYIGGARALAQIDPGFDDNAYRHSININKVFFDALNASGIQLMPFPSANMSLSTCAGVQEQVLAYKLPANVSFSLKGADGEIILSVSDAVVFVKDPPAQAKRCGGIASWTVPGALIGASFLQDVRQIMFDPFKSVVWFHNLQLPGTSQGIHQP